MKTPTILVLGSVLMFAGCTFSEKSADSPEAQRSVASSRDANQQGSVKESLQREALQASGEASATLFQKALKWPQELSFFWFASRSS